MRVVPRDLFVEERRPCVAERFERAERLGAADGALRAPLLDVDDAPERLTRVGPSLSAGTLKLRAAIIETKISCSCRRVMAISLVRVFTKIDACWDAIFMEQAQRRAKIRPPCPVQPRSYCARTPCMDAAARWPSSAYSKDQLSKMGGSTSAISTRKGLSRSGPNC